MPSDKYYLDFIRNTKFLKDQTKTSYLKKIDTIQNEIFKNHPNTIQYILEHPNDFNMLLNNYCLNNKGRSGPTLGNHTKDAFFSSIMSLFIYNQQLKENKLQLYQQWKALQDTVRKPIDDKYKSNEPTERQKQAYVSFDEIITVRDSLKKGHLSKLLLMMYTEIPPVRSDYYQTKILYDMPDFYDQQNNFIVLVKKNPFLVLQKYKTAKKYGMLIIDIPPKLQEEIEYSLLMIPRDFLFVSPRTHKPFEMENTFNKWANRTLKNIFDKQNFSLSILRHIYISRRDLRLEEKSGLEQEQIAKLMGHSIEQQRRYLWHSWLKKIDYDQK